MCIFEKVKRVSNLQESLKPKDDAKGIKIN